MSKPFTLSLFLAFVTAFGCSQAPDGFPKVVPCTITVTDNGQPVSAASVMIDTVPATPSLSVAAETNDQGKAVMFTFLGDYSASGVPVGKLVLTIFKEPEVPDMKNSAELDQMSPEKVQAYLAEIEAKRAKLPRIVPVELTDPKTSPLTMDAAAGKKIDWQVKLEDYRGIR